MGTTAVKLRSVRNEVVGGDLLILEGMDYQNVVPFAPLEMASVVHHLLGHGTRRPTGTDSNDTKHAHSTGDMFRIFGTGKAHPNFWH